MGLEPPQLLRCTSIVPNSSLLLLASLAYRHVLPEVEPLRYYTLTKYKVQFASDIMPGELLSLPKDSTVCIR